MLMPGRLRRLTALNSAALGRLAALNSAALRRLAALGLLAAAVPACVLVGEEPSEFGQERERVSAVEVAELAIGRRDIRQRVGTLEGAMGEPGERTVDRVIAWVTDEIRAAGFQPAGEHNGYLQYPPDDAGDSTRTPSILAVLPGTDPSRGGEHVLLVTHLEIEEEGRGAVSTAALLEMADAFGALSRRPARPILLLVVTGPDGGAAGARWFAENPTVILSPSAAVLHLDLPRAPGKGSVLATGEPVRANGGSVLATEADAQAELARVTGELGLDPVAYHTRTEAAALPAILGPLTAGGGRGLTVAGEAAPGGAAGTDAGSGRAAEPEAAAAEPEAAAADKAELDPSAVARLTRLAFLLAHALADAPGADATRQ